MSADALLRRLLLVLLLLSVVQAALNASELPALSAVWFYKLFRPINPWAASTLGIWGTVNAVVIMVSAIALHSAIDLANSALPVEDKGMLVHLLTRIISNAWLIGGLFFGLWLLPMGYIVISSKRMPVWMGGILLAGGAGYILQTLLSTRCLPGR